MRRETFAGKKRSFLPARISSAPHLPSRSHPRHMDIHRRGGCYSQRRRPQAVTRLRGDVTDFAPIAPAREYPSRQSP